MDDGFSGMIRMSLNFEEGSAATERSRLISISNLRHLSAHVYYTFVAIGVEPHPRARMGSTQPFESAITPTLEERLKVWPTNTSDLSLMNV